MIIHDESVTTREVKSWQGLHLLHFQGSTCSQKVRLVLGELELQWTSHPVNLMKHENATPWFLGINPRGVVPVLVHDGVVHVESNDIITYLDERYAKPGSSYFFDADDPRAAQARSWLDVEDSLHSDMRLLTIEFGPLRLKSERQLDAQQTSGAFDEKRDSEVRWWRARLANGTSRAELQEACARLRDAFVKLDTQLADSAWLMGDQISIVDIAWFVNIQRAVRIGYPLALHENLYPHYLKLASRPAFVADARHRLSRVTRAVFAGCRFRNRLGGNQILDYL